MITKVAVLGSGTMGCGIALFFAERNLAVRVYDPNEKAFSGLKEAMKKKSKALDLQWSTHLAEVIEDAELIIESVPEQLSLKHGIYKELTPYLKDTAILASNTSSYSLDLLAEGFEFKDRMLITHFFNPAEIIPLVEIVSLPSTPSSITERVFDFMTFCGKVPVVLNKDIDGFIANRLQSALLREACYLLESGIANEEQIDKVVTAGIGLRWAISGPFEIADRGGLDIWKKVLVNLLNKLSNTTQVPSVISEKVSQNCLGQKTGSGFFDKGTILEANVFKQKLNQLLKIKMG